jgi:hypothetical protein
MKPVNIENLEYLLTRIWSGELEHDQSSFFCSTACCLAGWDVALNTVEQPVDPRLRRQWYVLGETNAYSDPWEWSRDHNKLGETEARLLFDKSATKSLHQAVLTAFMAGRRVSMPDYEFDLFDSLAIKQLSSDEKLSYDSPCLVTTDWKEMYAALREFLGEAAGVQVELTSQLYPSN